MCWLYTFLSLLVNFVQTDLDLQKLNFPPEELTVESAFCILQDEINIGEIKVKVKTVLVL